MKTADDDNSDRPRKCLSDDRS